MTGKVRMVKSVLYPVYRSKYCSVAAKDVEIGQVFRLGPDPDDVFQITKADGWKKGMKEVTIVYRRKKTVIKPHQRLRLVARFVPLSEVRAGDYILKDRIYSVVRKRGRKICLDYSGKQTTFVVGEGELLEKF